MLKNNVAAIVNANANSVMLLVRTERDVCAIALFNAINEAVSAALQKYDKDFDVSSYVLDEDGTAIY